MAKRGNFLSILIPSATVFISSSCIMILELVASRLIARHLGSSLYTWTAVIGIVLAGITIGNYCGGRIADRFPARKALAVLFLISSVACVITIILNNLVGEWVFLWRFNWPLRVFSHVSLVFLLPSVLLGMISPVVAKTALDQGLETGRTVGDIYAWGAAGSIAGTFAAGYYLIATMGTVAIIWTISIILLVMASFYWLKYWLLYAWGVVLITALVLGMAPTEWARDTGASLALRENPDPKVIYEDESQYCFIHVKQISENPDKRAFMQDKLMHSEIIMGNLNDLQYFHTIIFAGVTHGLSRGKETLSVMNIGGGGYVFPRYVEKNWPGSRVDVAEIDIRVTEAAMQAFGLERDTTINTETMDARNYVDTLLERERRGIEKVRYDFIYEDAFSDYSVPFQLVTKEFNDMIYKILTDDGVYMINSIDVYNSGLFVGAYVNTLKQTFPYVYVATGKSPKSNREIFVLVASKIEFNLEKLVSQYTDDYKIWYLNDDEINTLIKQADGIVLTDDYVPVENLLAPVVKRSAKEFLADRYLQEAKELKEQGRWREAIDQLNKMVQCNVDMTVRGYNDIALIFAVKGNYEEAVKYLRKAIEYNKHADYQDNMANVHHSLSTALQRLGRMQEASDECGKAIEEYHKQLIETPNSLKTLINLGDLLASNGKFIEAAGYFQKAVNLNPMDLTQQFNLIQALELGGQLDQAIDANQKAIQFFSKVGHKDTVAKFQQYLDSLEYKASKKEK